MSKSSHITHFEYVDCKFTIVNDYVEVTGYVVYLPMATFITSYAKAYLLENINITLNILCIVILIVYI